jgi:putative acetyltransferase
MPPAQNLRVGKPGQVIGSRTRPVLRRRLAGRSLRLAFRSGAQNRLLSHHPQPFLHADQALRSTAMVFKIHPLLAADLPACLAVHRAAFPGDGEARLVELLAQRGKAVVSLAAEQDGQVVGHVLFSPVTIDAGEPAGAAQLPAGLGLAPLAVLPAFQNQGIGAALVRAGIDACRQQQCPYVVVLGEPAYYNRFGFVPASGWNLRCEFGGGDAFQILPLGGSLVPLPAGSLVRYAQEFTEIFAPTA